MRFDVNNYKYNLGCVTTVIYKEWLGEQSMLRSELAAKDSLIEEQRKEIEVNIYSFTYVHMYVHSYLFLMHTYVSCVAICMYV